MKIAGVVLFAIYGMALGWVIAGRASGSSLSEVQYVYPYPSGSMTIRTDSVTGCEYLYFGSGGLAARMEGTGTSYRHRGCH